MKKLWVVIVFLVMSINLQADDFEKAEKLCEGGDATGCLNLGTMYVKGEGVNQDSFKAVKFYEKACDGGDAQGCLNLGLMYSNGEGVRQNDNKAKELFGKELFGKACDGGVSYGCKNYAILNKK